MTDLIARIEAAQPSEARELFEEAAVAAWGVEAGEVVINDTALYERMCRFDDLLDAQAYLDAAAMFVPDQCEWEWNGATCQASIWRMPDQFPGGFERLGLSNATTPYFALLSAAMKARQTDERD